MAFSTQTLVSLLMLPWCMAISPAYSGCFSNIFWNQISHWLLVLVNKSVVFELLMMGITSSNKCNPKWPRQGKASIFSGMMLLTVIFLLMFAFIKMEFSKALDSGPKRTSRACSKLPMVAEIPQIRRFFGNGFESR